MTCPRGYDIRKNSLQRDFERLQTEAFLFANTPQEFQNSNLMIVEGPSGVGKSFAVREALRHSGLTVVEIAPDGNNIGEYLFNYNDPNIVLLLDDADGTVMSLACLRILRWATNTGKRKIPGGQRSVKGLDKGEGFEFLGRIIIITNINVAAKKVFKSLVSRSAHRVTMRPTIDELFHHACYTITEKMRPKLTSFSIASINDVLYWAAQNKLNLTDPSVRMLEFAIMKRHSVASLSEFKKLAIEWFVDKNLTVTKPPSSKDLWVYESTSEFNTRTGKTPEKSIAFEPASYLGDEPKRKAKAAVKSNRVKMASKGPTWEKDDWAEIVTRNPDGTVNVMVNDTTVRVALQDIVQI